MEYAEYANHVKEGIGLARDVSESVGAAEFVTEPQFIIAFLFFALVAGAFSCWYLIPQLGWQCAVFMMIAAASVGVYFFAAWAVDDSGYHEGELLERTRVY